MYSMIIERSRDLGTDPAGTGPVVKSSINGILGAVSLGLCYVELSSIFCVCKYSGARIVM